MMASYENEDCRAKELWSLTLRLRQRQERRAGALTGCRYQNPPRSFSICSLRRSVKKPLDLGAGAPVVARADDCSVQPGKPGPLSVSQLKREGPVQPMAALR